VSVLSASDDLAENRVRFERSLFGCLLEDSSLWPDADLTTDDFVLSDHRRIWQALCRLHNDGLPIDLVTVAAETQDKVDAHYISALIDGGHVPQNFKSYVKAVREGAQERRWRDACEDLAKADRHEKRTELLDAMRDTLKPEGTSGNWRERFDTWEQLVNAPPLTFPIQGVLQDAGITLIAGLAGSGKTMVMLNMVKSLLDESPLFGYEPFAVTRPAGRVLYLVPELTRAALVSRLKLFRLERYAKEDRLIVRTLNSEKELLLADPEMLEAAKDADIFLDSAQRFISGAENDAENIRIFANELFRLLQAGARTVVACHHSPKAYEQAQSMTLENILRGSGDLGAMASTVWGIRQIDPPRNRIYIGNCKPRDFEPCAPFILEGRPHLDLTGQFVMHARPGEAEELRSYLQQKGGRPLAPNRTEQCALAASLRAKNVSIRKIAEQMKTSPSSVVRMLDDYDLGDHGDAEERKPQ
jgi:hypothetical protein